MRRIYQLPKSGVHRLAVDAAAVWLPAGIVLLSATLLSGPAGTPWWGRVCIAAGVGLGVLLGFRHFEAGWSEFHLVIGEDFIEQVGGGETVRLERTELKAIVELPGRGLQLHGPDNTVSIPEGLDNYEGAREAIASWGTPRRGPGRLVRSVPGLSISLVVSALLLWLGR